MKEKILLVEDDEHLPLAWRAAILTTADSAIEVLVARNYREALDFARSEDISYAVVDLGLPERPGGEVVEIGPGEVCSLGFDLLRSLQEFNSGIEITIASRFTDNARVAQLKNRLILDENAPIRRVLNKNSDPDYLDKILEDTCGLAELEPHLAAAGVRAIHPLERKLARKLWRKASVAVDSWPTPILVLRGESRSGKGAWARAYTHFVNAQRPSNVRPQVATLDLGQLSGPGSGDSPLVGLFGARNYQGIADCPGVFERATRYKGQSHRGERSLARGTDLVDYFHSGVACLDELGNLYLDLQPMLLSVLDSNPQNGGQVRPAGGGGYPIPIGCSIVFMTNAAVESRVARSDAAQPGELREDLYHRLRAEPDGWLYVPSISDLGATAALDHLERELESTAGQSIEISESVNSLIVEAVEREGNQVTMETVRSIVEQFLRVGGARLTDEHLLASIGNVAGNESQPRVKKRSWTMDDFVRHSVVRANEKQYYILKILLEHVGERLTGERIRHYLDDSAELAAVREDNNWNRYNNKQAMSQALSQLRKKVNEEEVAKRSRIRILDRGWGALRIG